MTEQQKQVETGITHTHTHGLAPARAHTHTDTPDMTRADRSLDVVSVFLLAGLGVG